MRIRIQSPGCKKLSPIVVPQDTNKLYKAITSVREKEGASVFTGRDLTAQTRIDVDDDGMMIKNILQNVQKRALPASTSSFMVISASSRSAFFLSLCVGPPHLLIAMGHA